MGKDTVTDFDIQALVDCELGAAHERKVRDYLHKDHQARRRYQELLKQKALLQEWWDTREH
jgi:anti-sigma factor RsiW